MNDKPLIPTQTLCSHYNIEISFVDALGRMGLIEIEIIEEDQYIHQDQIGELEKIIRLYNELNLNLEGIDAITHLLNKMNDMNDENITLRNNLNLFSTD